MRHRARAALLAAAACALPRLGMAQAAEAVRVPHDGGQSVAAPPAAPRRYGPPAPLRQQQAVPSQYAPPAGMCRVWVHGVPPEQQPAPTDCAKAVRVRSSNSRVVFGTSKPTPRLGAGSIVPREPSTPVDVPTRTGVGRATARVDVERGPAAVPPSVAGSPSTGSANSGGLSPRTGTGMSPGAGSLGPRDGSSTDRVEARPAAPRVAEPPPRPAARVRSAPPPAPPHQSVRPRR